MDRKYEGMMAHLQRLRREQLEGVNHEAPQKDSEPLPESTLALVSDGTQKAEADHIDSKRADVQTPANPSAHPADSAEELQKDNGQSSEKDRTATEISEAGKNPSEPAEQSEGPSIDYSSGMDSDRSIDTEETKVRDFMDEVNLNNVKLITLTEAERQYYLQVTQEGLSFGKSVSIQNSKTEALYLGFARALGLTPYPVTEKLGMGFIEYLAHTKKFCHNTLSTVTYQSLIRLNISRTGQDIPLPIRAAIRRKLSEIRLSPDTKPGRGGMEPLILDDIKRIIVAMKDVDPIKPDLASLFLFGIYTGSRANSCVNVFFSDFHSLRYHGENKYTIHVDVRHMKGKPGFVFELALGGNPD